VKSMENNSRTQPLIEWNRLTIENTETAMVSSMLETTVKASEPLETFSGWLLAATAVIATFMITNGDKLSPILGHVGYLICGLFLLLSCFFGFISKVFALRCKITSDINKSVKTTFDAHLDKYEEQEKLINDNAKIMGVSLQTGIRIDRVINSYFEYLPKWIRWYAKRQLSKSSTNPHLAYIPQIKVFLAQSQYCFFQILFFLAFLSAGFVFAASP
jgi:Ca2+/Na+ antiporter